MQVRLLHPDAVAPTRTRAGDAGYDLRSVAAVTLAPGMRELVPTGVAIALPPGHAGLVVPRSGLAVQHGLSVVNGPGLVDPEYRGELKVVLINHGPAPVALEPGDRIAQLLVVPFAAPEIEVVDALEETDRGAAGFGSSGRR